MFGYWSIFFLGVYAFVADNTSVESRCCIANITNIIILLVLGFYEASNL